MKRSILSLALTFISFLSFSQGFSISPSDSVHLDVQIGGYYTATIDLPFNASPNDTVFIGWELLSVETPAGSNWDYSYCDYTSCYTANVTTSVMTPIMDGQMAFFKVNVIPDTPGFGRFKVKVYNNDDPLNFSVLTFTFNSTLSVFENVSENIVVYPNPCTEESINIKNVSNITNMSIVSSTGSIMYYSEELSESVNIEVSNYSPGVYFIHFVENTGDTSTQKLMIK